MIQVSGETYRLESFARAYRVIRVADDRWIGAFTLEPALRVLESEIAHDELMQVARAALRAARLPWTGKRARAEASTKPASHIWSVGSLQGIAHVLLGLWPLIALSL